MKPKERIVLVVLIYILATIQAVNAAEIVHMQPHSYKYEFAKGMEKDTFVITEIDPQGGASELSGATDDMGTATGDNLAPGAVVPADLDAEDTETQPETEANSPGMDAISKPANRVPFFLGFNKANKNKVLGKFLIHFDLNSAEIKPEMAKLLNRYTTNILKAKVRVTGYTCQCGTIERNIELAQERAQAVATVLEKLGIEVVEINGKPNCCYLSTTNLEANRRVLVEVIN